MKIVKIDRIEYTNENGQLHRENGPAIEHSNGSKYWYLNGKLHRENGPAIKHPDGSKFWYINNKIIVVAVRNHNQNNLPIMLLYIFYHFFVLVFPYIFVK